MATYQITSTTGGQILGTFDADSPDEAFQACCRAAGYPDLAATNSDGKLLCDRSDVSIVEVQPEPATCYTIRLYEHPDEAARVTDVDDHEIAGDVAECDASGNYIEALAEVLA